LAYVQARVKTAMDALAFREADAGVGGQKRADMDLRELTDWEGHQARTVP